MNAPTLTRRTFLKNAGTVAAGFLTGCASISPARKKTDIRIEDISFAYDEYKFRAPVGFAGAIVNRATIITVKCSVRSAGGKPATGFGSMPFNHTFSFPSKTLSNESKNDARLKSRKSAPPSRNRAIHSKSTTPFFLIISKPLPKSQNACIWLTQSRHSARS
jgi:hypothetical protein